MLRSHLALLMILLAAPAMREAASAAVFMAAVFTAAFMAAAAFIWRRLSWRRRWIS